MKLQKLKKQCDIKQPENGITARLDTEILKFWRHLSVWRCPKTPRLTAAPSIKFKAMKILKNIRWSSAYSYRKNQILRRLSAFLKRAAWLVQNMWLFFPMGLRFRFAWEVVSENSQVFKQMAQEGAWNVWSFQDTYFHTCSSVRKSFGSAVHIST